MIFIVPLIVIVLVVVARSRAVTIAGIAVLGGVFLMFGRAKGDVMSVAVQGAGLATVMAVFLFQRGAPGQRLVPSIVTATSRRAAEVFSDKLFTPFFVLYTGLAVAWLVTGLAPVVAASSTSVHSAFHEWGVSTGLVAEFAENAARASHSAYGLGQVSTDYLFSVLNFGLGTFLVLRGPRHRAARLLAIGMAGTAVAFNLQGHFAFQVAPSSWLGAISIWHQGAIHVLSGVCYVLALLLFPDGKLSSRRRVPYMVVVSAVFAMLSFITIEDHTFGLVVVFGIITPIAGVSSQFRRYRAAPNAEQRQQSKLLMWGLVPALTAAVFLIVAGNTLVRGEGFSQTTRRYEFETPEAGTYFFRCDPHPDTMIGRLVVESGVAGVSGQPTALITATSGEFDKGVLTLPAGREVVVKFTNKDGDRHNVAFYQTSSAESAIFVGEEFAGQTLTALAFRVFQPVFIIIPITLMVGLLRFRLWDMDKVINRALVYGALAGFITIVYAGVVVGISTAIGSTSERHLGLSILATGIVAFAFEPLRERLQRVANRLIFGRRATPYELLANFSERVAGTYSGESGLQRLAQVVSEGTGAARAEVWLVRDEELVPVASWPETPALSNEKRSLREWEVPRFADATRVMPVRDQGELLGVLVVRMNPGEEPSPVEDTLLTDLASQAGLALRNLGLTAELQARFDEISDQAENLRASRRRIVEAQDSRRRQLERDIHDGAQQHLVALAVKLRLAQSLAERDPEKARPLLRQLKEEGRDALETLRDLALGIYPPLLADGLVETLRAQALKSGLVLKVRAESVGRYSPELEAAVYFCCLEAIQNTSKYARATAITIGLTQQHETLSFSVRDDGIGFDPESTIRGAGLQNMTDRIEALGGTIEVRSRPGEGTLMLGSIPIRAGVAVS